MAAGGQVKVGAAELDDTAEDVVDVERGGAQRAFVRAPDWLGGEGDAQRCVVRFRFVH